MDRHNLLDAKLGTAEERIQKVFHLLVENSQESVLLLQRGLKSDPSPIVRHECAYSLGELSLDDGHEALIDAIMSDDNSFVVHEAALALSNLGVASARPVLEGLLDHPDQDVVLTAKISLQRLDMRVADIKFSDLGVPAKDMIMDLTAPAEHRIQASFDLLEDGSMEAVRALITALHQETDPIVKHEIIFALGETASPEVVPHLIEEMLSDDNLFVKHEAALALGTIGNPEGEDAISQLLHHPHPDIAESAEIALERLRT